MQHRPARRLLAAALVAVISAAGMSTRAAAAVADPAGPTTTTTVALPPLPAVDPALTAGQQPATLLARALTLSSVGLDGTALLSALGRTQARLDADAAAAQRAEAAVARADASARQARQTAAEAAATYRSMSGAIRQAVIFLYTSGSGALTISPRAGSAALYAADYAEATVGPYGVLVRARREQTRQRTLLRAATHQQDLADASLARARAALGDQRVQMTRLQGEVRALSASSAAAVTVDHQALASEAGAALTGAGGNLQFSPKSPLPAPLPTTPVALAWAFAQLGKPYLWGATGPDSFDCSGLTQYVWRAAGVSIPRVSEDQYAWTVPVPLSDLLPGDLVFFGTTDIHHVGIYIGDGLMINAPHTGDVVRVSSIWWSDLAGFGRVHFDGVPVPAQAVPSTSHPAPPDVLASRGPVPSQVTPPPGARPVTSTPVATAGTTTTTAPPAPAPVATTLPVTSTVPAVTGPAAPTTSATVPEPGPTTTSTP